MCTDTTYTDFLRDVPPFYDPKVPTNRRIDVLLQFTDNNRNPLRSIARESFGGFAKFVEVRKSYGKFNAAKYYQTLKRTKFVVSPPGNGMCISQLVQVSV